MLTMDIGTLTLHSPLLPMVHVNKEKKTAGELLKLLQDYYYYFFLITQCFCESLESSRMILMCIFGLSSW